MRSIVSTAAAAAILCAALVPAAQAQLSSYSQDFEALNAADPNALIDDGWLGFGAVFDAGGTPLFNYGVFGAPNGGAGFSAIASGQGGVDQGLQQLSIYNDYNCCQPSNGHFGAGTDIVESLVFQTQTIGAADVGTIWVFSFEARKGNIAGTSTAGAFIKTLDVDAGFATTNFIITDTTATPDSWTAYTVTLYIDASLVGQQLDFGFLTKASSFAASGVFYDNLSFDRLQSVPTLRYSQDFEALDPGSFTALEEDGWLVWGNVFEPNGDLKFSYGPFGAPNASGVFSGIAFGEGGPPQGDQQLVVFSDYQCCLTSNEGHFNGVDIVESIVYRERAIAADDIGSTWVFRFDAKRGNIDEPSGGGNVSAQAFIRTVDLQSGGVLSNEISADTTSLPVEWSEGITVSITLTDPLLEGQLFQIGFANTSSAFYSTGVVYDNIVLEQYVEADADGDGIGDSIDNCIDVANPQQTDTNADGIGNECDPDIGGGAGVGQDDCIVNFIDLGFLKNAFFSSSTSPNWNPDADLVVDGQVNFIDLGRMKEFFFSAPGPSASECAVACAGGCIGAGSELAFFGDFEILGAADLASAVGLSFPDPAIVVAATGDFAFADGGNVALSSFNFNPPMLGPVLTFDGGGAFYATSLTINFQSALQLDLTLQGRWILDGFDDTPGALDMNLGALGSIMTFSAIGGVAP